MSQSWVTIGSVRKDIKGNNNIVFSKGITILKDGVEVELGQYRLAKCFDATESVERLVAAGHIPQDKKDERLSYINDKNIMFDVTVPPVKAEFE